MGLRMGLVGMGWRNVMSRYNLSFLQPFFYGYSFVCFGMQRGESRYQRAIQQSSGSTTRAWAGVFAAF
jgi:hypothetical protein